MLSLQRIVEDLLAKNDVLETFRNSQNVIYVFQKREERLVVKRHVDDIEISKEPNYWFGFQWFPFNPSWGTTNCKVDEVTYPTYLSFENKPFFSAKNYDLFLTKAEALVSELENGEWKTKAILMGKALPFPATAEQRAEIRLPKFQVAIEKLLNKHGLLEAFNDPKWLSVYLKLHQASYMDLVIERNGPSIVVGHYCEQNGDLISDPVLVFRLDETVRTWIPIRIEQIFGDSWVEIERDGKRLVIPKMQREFQTFSNVFARNIMGQGWMEADVLKKLSQVEEDEDDIKMDSSMGQSLLKFEPMSGVQMDFAF